MNLYVTDGAIIAEGLPLPRGMRIVAVGNNTVYITKDAYLDDDGSVTPMQLWTYNYKRVDELATLLTREE